MMSEWTLHIDGWIILAGVLSAGSCALLGSYLVLRKMSLMGDAISHAVLPGIAAAFIISESRSPLLMFLGAVVVGLLTAILSETIRRLGKVEHGAAMGVVFSVLFAGGLIMIRRAAALDSVDIDPDCVLFGSIELIPLDAIGGSVPVAVVNLLVVALIDTVFVGLFYKELKICAFDPELATTLGINATLMHYLLMIMVAVTTVACFEAVGSILVIAMLIVPPAAAYLLTDRLGVMIPLGVLLSCVAAVVGHWFATDGPGWLGMSEVENVQSAAMMAVVAGAIFATALLLSPRYGLISRAFRQLSLSMRIVAEDILGLLYRWQELGLEGATPMPRGDVIRAVGGGWISRFALLVLHWQGRVESVQTQHAGSGCRLTQKGLGNAARLVRSHRLWETYLARNFRLPLDHLHMPAERMEHYITPTLSDDLEDQVSGEKLDPHGREIPEREA